jgi:hypothetical protein
MMHNRHSVRLIPGDVWHKIKKLFPKALTHSFEYKNNNATGNCVQCHLETEEERLFPQRLNEWKRKVLQPPLNELFKRGKQANKLYPSKIDLLLRCVAEEPLLLRILSRADVQRWRDSFLVVEKATKKNNDIIRNQLNDLFFVPSTSSTSGREWKFQSLLCKEHQLTVGTPSVSKQEDITKWLDELIKSNVELLLVDEYDELLSSLSFLESILHGGNGSDPLPLTMNSQPNVSIRLQEKTPIVVIEPQTCTYGCTSCSLDDDCIEIDRITSAKPDHKDETIDEAPEDPLCKVFVHEVENGTSIDVAASIITVNASHENNLSLTATGRPRRSRKARGDEGIYSVEEVEMAVDGNLAHLRLLLHQYKGKKIHGQRLYLLQTHPPKCEDAPTFTELLHEYDRKSIHEILSLLDSNYEARSADKQGNRTIHIHMVLSYDDGESNKTNKRTRLNKEEKDEEDGLVLSLSDIACGGWKSDDGNVVIEGKQTKRRRQERGFQGTFLQSTEFDVQEILTCNKPEQDNSEEVVFIDSVEEGKHVARAHDDIIDLQLGVEEDITKAVKITESSRFHAKPTNRDDIVDEASEGPLCKIFVHEVENGTSIDVAASIITVNASIENTQRIRHPHKSRGDSGGFPVEVVDMALDGNLAYLRLYLHENKSKQLRGQRIYLLHTSSSECEGASTFTELAHEDNFKSVREIIYQSAPEVKFDNSEQKSHCAIHMHMVLSYDEGDSTTLSRRQRLNKEEKYEEASLVLSLSDIAFSGQTTEDDSAAGGKQTKRRRQERGFQGALM